jgi:hypothetical protein
MFRAILARGRLIEEPQPLTLKTVLLGSYNALVDAEAARHIALDTGIGALAPVAPRQPVAVEIGTFLFREYEALKPLGNAAGCVVRVQTVVGEAVAGRAIPLPSRGEAPLLGEHPAVAANATHTEWIV